jgi:hypothetical protein
MSDFHTLRTALLGARAQQEARVDAVAADRQQVLRLLARRDALLRTLQLGDAQGAAQLQALDVQIAKANGELQTSQASLQHAIATAANTVANFAFFADPQTAVKQMPAATPFLLFPLRLETRFLPNDSGGMDLCVRVYPDDCSVDTFEAALTDGEVRSARAYWTGVWRAGGDKVGERGAWHELVASHGSGRAAWIMDHHAPLNAADRPAKNLATEIVLVIPTEAPPTQARRDALVPFWTAVWKADGDPVKEKAAYDALAVALQADAQLAAEAYRPANPAEPPPHKLSRAATVVKVVWIVFPSAEGMLTRQQSWSRAPRVSAFPDRLVLMAYEGSAADPLVKLGNPIQLPLAVGPDPYAEKQKQLRQEAGELKVPAEMLWMTDFQQAVKVGMGLRVKLNATQAINGFKELLVLGVRASETADEGRQTLETLLAHHRDGRSGLALVPQGTPTNNTEGVTSGYRRTDDPDASFDERFGTVPPDPLLAQLDPWMARTDGEWLAALLGLDPAVLHHVPNARGTDQAEARAMNAALWPGTLGYWMDALMTEAFPEEMVEHARHFFTRYVSGRGAVPALRIGRQPYGILTATAYSRLSATKLQGTEPVEDPFLTFLRPLIPLLALAREDWDKMAADVSYVGKPLTDAHRNLLGLLALHPDSAEYALRRAESLEQVHNELALIAAGLTGDFSNAKELLEKGLALLDRYGYLYPDIPPELLYRFFFSTADPLNGPVVDDVPSSESKEIRAYAGTRNYIQWLIEASLTSLETLRAEDGFTGGKPPRALLYLLLRYALETGYHDTGRRVYRDHGMFQDDDDAVRASRREAPFIHLATEAAGSESRYARLYAPAPAITNHPQMMLADWVTLKIDTLDQAAPFREQLLGLRRLADRPTARLERLLAEHVDCCAYRLDAWMLGLVHYWLAELRNVRDGDSGPPKRGVYLGAYAWLHDVRPEPREFSDPGLSPDLAAVFKPQANPPLRRDAANQGFIHAPSLNHAVTAAVLRNGYLADATAVHAKALAVNLTSERVRTALGLLEGMRAGQSLGALLGYQLERGLHERWPGVELDSFIWEMRREFPLGGNKLASTKVEGEAAEKVEARNVVDGLALIQHVRSLPEADRKYKWGKSLLPAASADQANAINAEVNRLMDAHDAVADLAIAEGVHQAVQGNYDRTAGTLDAYSKGAYPPEPDVVRTPAPGVGLTHRLAIHLDASALPGVSPIFGVVPDMTPRAAAEPALNAWLATVLPSLVEVGCVAIYRQASDDAEKTATVTLAQLGLQPIDVLFLVRDESQQAMSELDDRVVMHVAGTYALRPGSEVRIAFMQKGAAAISVFELMPLARALRRIAFASRPLRASDLSLGGEANEAQDRAPALDRARVKDARDALWKTWDDEDPLTDTGLKDLRARVTGPPDPANPTAAADKVNWSARRPVLLNDVDLYLTDAVTRLSRLARFGVGQAGWGFVYAWRTAHADAILAKTAELVQRWDARLTEHDLLVIQAADATLPDDTRIAMLLRAGRLVSTLLTITPVTDPSVFAATVLAPKRQAMLNRRAQFAAVLSAPPLGAKALLDAVRLDTTAFDPVPWPLDDDEARVVAFARQLVGVLDAAGAEVERRVKDADAALAKHDGTAVPTERVEALQAGAKAVFGDEFVLPPRFTLGVKPAAEMTSAFAASEGLLKHLTDVRGIDFPVDEWMYGVARVREKVRAWEETVMIGGGFSGVEPALTPMQLPYRDGDSWLALQFPDGYALDHDRLLYTAHAPGFKAEGMLCGLLVDEWTEVIPSRQATTGVAFHYDRPNHEPPQAMLLVTPPTTAETWEWADLVDAVRETIQLARVRGVEPAQVQDGAYAAFLPATVMAVTASPITIMVNLARNNDFTTFLTLDGD